MKEMTKHDAIIAGGWDPRYAVVRAIVSTDTFAAVVVDPNGDGGSIDLDQYRRGPDGEFVAESSGGGAGDSGSARPPTLVATYGRTEPRAQVLVDYCGQTHSLTADDDGWWLFATEPLDDHSFPMSHFAGHRPY